MTVLSVGIGQWTKRMDGRDRELCHVETGKLLIDGKKFAKAQYKSTLISRIEKIIGIYRADGSYGR